MIEPVSIYPHHWPGGKRIIFDCGNGYGLSVSTAPGPRRDHGIYCDNTEGLPTQYEALIIKDVKQITPDFWDYSFINMAVPKGWLYIEEIGEIIEAIQEKGKDGWPAWNTPWNEDEDDN